MAKFDVKLFSVVALVCLTNVSALGRFANFITVDTLITSVVDSSRIVTINRIVIVGNKRTRDQIILRELSFKEGDTVRFYKLPEIHTQDKQKIYNLRLFNTVTVRSLEISNDTVDLLVEVSERWYTWPIPIFELSDRNFNEWWQNYNHDFGRVNYGLRVEQYNCRGRNETLKLTAQFGFAQRFELSYVIPYLDKKQKQGLSIDFEFATLRNLAARTEDHKIKFLPTDATALIDGKPVLRTSVSAQVGYTYRKSFYETHSFSLGYRSNDILDQVAIYNPNYFNNSTNTQKYANLSYSFRSEHRDVILYPLKGYQFSAHIQKNGLGFEGDVSQWIVNLTYAYHQDLKKGFYLSNFSSVYLSDPSQQPYNLQGALGHSRQIVRGYEVYVVEGPNFAVNKTTFKKKIFSSSSRWERLRVEQFKHVPIAIFIKAFADFGYVENYNTYQERNQNTRLSGKLLSGAGGGIDLVLPYDIVCRFEYTFTRESTQGFFFNLKKEF